MPESYGNLALKNRRSAAARENDSPSAASRLDIKTRRIPVTATPAPEQMGLIKARAIRRSLSIKRLKMLLGIMMIVFVLTGIFALVVYRQAMILEMNFSNLAVERQIAKLNQEGSQISESLAQKTNLDLIRRQAVEKLGLQDPARRQIVTVSIPNTDRVVFVSQQTGNPDDEAYLANVFSTLEGYFKTLNQKGQGD